MGMISRLRGVFETRAQEQTTVSFEDPLLQALLGGGGVTREMALQVPAVSGGIDLIANVVAGTPIKLYREKDGRTEEVRGDRRVRLLNDETGDTLNGAEFWRAIVRDYYLGKGGYAYIRRERGAVAGLHYVDERRVSIEKNDDPIFKDFKIRVSGGLYEPFDFLRILRNTRDGATGTPITEENSKLIEVAYQTLCFELYLVRKGGNKKGFLQSEKKIDDVAMEKLKKSFSNLYSTNSDNVIVLNNGVKFQESSNTSVEMQLNENKQTNAEEFARLFHVSTDMMAGGKADTASLAKLAAIPLMKTIECALNRDLLLEREKGEMYFAFDAKELLKGDMRERFAAYKTALDANFMQIDEVRYAEDMEPLGLTWIKLGLQDVLYDPKTQTVYTPNTDRTGGFADGRLTDGGAAGRLEETRANPNHGSDGRFTTAPGGAKHTGRKSGKKVRGKVKNAQRISIREYERLCHEIATDFPNLKSGEIIKGYSNRSHLYSFEVVEFGTYRFTDKKNLK